MVTVSKVVDAHMHLYDHQVNKHSIFDEINPVFMNVVGDYSALPEKYLWEDYLKDSANHSIGGVIWYEFMSANPIQEATWTQNVIKRNNIRAAMVTLVDFLDPELEKKLDVYRSLPNVTSVREHLAWDHSNPKKRFASRPDLLTDPLWNKGFKLLKNYNFNCALEVFSTQLSDLIQLIRNNPHIGFTIPAMGWPLDLSKTGYEFWQRALKEVSQLENICLEIHGLECIFGMKWTVEQVKPWVLSAIEIMGTKRCMFGSHMPIAKLSRNFDALYDAYEKILEGFSDNEKEDLFCNVAVKWFKL